MTEIQGATLQDPHARMTDDEILVAVMSVAADLAMARQQLVDVMAAAIRAGVSPERLAGAIIGPVHEIPPALITDALVGR